MARSLVIQGLLFPAKYSLRNTSQRRVCLACRASAIRTFAILNHLFARARGETYKISGILRHVRTSFGFVESSRLLRRAARMSAFAANLNLLTSCVLADLAAIFLSRRCLTCTRRMSTLSRVFIFHKILSIPHKLSVTLSLPMACRRPALTP